MSMKCQKLVKMLIIITQSQRWHIKMSNNSPHIQFIIMYDKKHMK